jgi:CheY-like chemotaxis protein
MLEARLADSPVRGLIVDLDMGDLGVDLIRRIRQDERARGVSIVAFGPHVAADLFAAAREAGADRVMARGAFAERLPEVVTTLAGPAEPGEAGSTSAG